MTSTASAEERKRNRAIAASGCCEFFGRRATKRVGRLNLGRHRADEIDARDMDQFGDLLETDFRLPAGDDGSHQFAGRGTAYLARLAATSSATPSFLKPIVDR
jgi:hypothetical protein